MCDIGGGRVVNLLFSCASAITTLFTANASKFHTNRRLCEFTTQKKIQNTDPIGKIPSTQSVWCLPGGAANKSYW